MDLTPEETAAGWRLLFDGSTTQGWRRVKLVSPRQVRTISGPRNRMLRAMAAFSGTAGTSAYPRVATARVMERKEEISKEATGSLASGLLAEARYDGARAALAGPDFGGRTPANDGDG